jgi:serine protease Do
VIAVGNALGEFQNTVTSGIISGMNRSITASDEDGSGSENLTGLIQTDAAINSGNSGGPLITYDGKVVGMNTAVASSANNIGFAIPIDSISSSIASVTKGGKINKAYLGVYYTTITPALAKSKNLAVSNGAYVGGDNTNATVSGSPADKAGIKSGDIITKIGDTTLDTNNTLSVVIGKHAAGDKVTLTILRDGKTMTVDVTLGSAADVNSKN